MKLTLEVNLAPLLSKDDLMAIEDNSQKEKITTDESAAQLLKLGIEAKKRAAEKARRRG